MLRRGCVIVASGIVFCAVTSFLGGTSLLMGAIAQSWVPYVSVPFAMGFVAARKTVLRAGPLGALTSFVLVVAFYAAGDPARTGGYAVDTASIYEYGGLGLVTGFVLAASSRSLAPRVARAPGRWALTCCAVLTVALVASWLISGWGAYQVHTSSGVVSIGASTADVVISSLVVLAFGFAVITVAVRGLSEVADSIGPRNGPRGGGAPGRRAAEIPKG